MHDEKTGKRVAREHLYPQEGQQALECQTLSVSQPVQFHLAAQTLD
jgi:hypothetical protein